MNTHESVGEAIATLRVVIGTHGAKDSASRPVGYADLRAWLAALERLQAENETLKTNLGEQTHFHRVNREGYVMVTKENIDLRARLAAAEAERDAHRCIGGDNSPVARSARVAQMERDMARVRDLEARLAAAEAERDAADADLDAVLEDRRRIEVALDYFGDDLLGELHRRIAQAEHPPTPGGAP